MASFLQKFARGGAAAGGVLFADMAREQLRAGIMTERDDVLNANRQTMEKSRQEASTLQHEQRLAQQESEFVRGLDSPRAQADKIKLTSAKNLENLKTQYAAATTDAERDTIAKQMAAEQGKPLEGKPGSGTKPTAGIQEARVLATLDEFKNEAEALKFLKSKEGNMVKSVFTQLLQSQEDAMVQPDEQNYLTVEAALLKAREIIKPQKPATGGGDGDIEQFNTTKHPSVKTQADFDKLESGALYFDVFDGKSYRKP